ncbi:MAG TPA: alpha/beta fold hydrolase [Candidatus Saccharimonadales bacterium]|jgi:pimeloyl-ACP methyl ester carboxylesterase
MQTTKLRFKDRFWHKLLGRPYRLHVIDHGGDKPVIVLLHGLGSSSANWHELTPLLKASYRCITIDLLGFGSSPKPQWVSYSMEDHIRSIQATLNALHLHQPYILLGHSLGSLLATRYARHHANYIRRLILLSPPVYAPIDTIKNRSARQRTSIYLRAYRFLRTHHRATPENMARLGNLLPHVNPFAITRDTWTPFVRSLEQCIENQTLIADIKDVSVPIDIYYGIFDEVVVPYNVKQLAKIRDVELHPLRVNHVVGKRYAKSVATALLKQA